MSKRMSERVGVDDGVEIPKGGGGIRGGLWSWEKDDQKGEDCVRRGENQRKKDCVMGDCGMEIRI